jgi:hypothetical protein
MLTSSRQPPGRSSPSLPPLPLLPSLIAAGQFDVDAQVAVQVRLRAVEVEVADAGTDRQRTEFGRFLSENSSARYCGNARTT